MGRPVIVSACRTPVGRFQGGLAPRSAPELGTVAAVAALQKAGLPGEAVDEVVMGHVLQAGVGQNPARQVLRGAGLPDALPAVTINKVCGSGLKAVMLAAQAIKAGDAKAVLAGGMESMSNVPYYLPQARTGMRLGHARAVDGLIADGLWDVYNDFHMGSSAELVAREHGVTREQQDAYAAESHRRAVAARQSGAFDAEITPVEVAGRKGEVTVVDRDEGPRADSTPGSLARLRPAFEKDGTVTPGNASSINDGAAAVVVMDEEEAEKRGIRPLARILDYTTGGVAPEWVLMAPEVAIRRLCERTGTEPGDFELIEINEAFASQMVALTRVLGIDPDRLNVHGGAIALGHPIGCSGARVLTTLVHAMETRKAGKGLAGLCLGGGNAVVMAVERIGS